MRVVARILWYAVACLGVVGVLWLAVVTRPDGLLLIGWIVADTLALVVTWRVATRDHRRRDMWVVVTAFVGPLAWIAMAASAPKDNDPVRV